MILNIRPVGQADYFVSMQDLQFQNIYQCTGYDLPIACAIIQSEPSYEYPRPYLTKQKSWNP